MPSIAEAPGLPLLETPLVRLREHRAADLAALRLVLGDPEVTRYMAAGPLRPHAIAALLAEARADAARSARTAYRLAACPAGTDTAAGTVRLTVENTSTGYIDGLAFASGRQAAGLGPDTMWLALQLAFSHLRLNRCWAWIHQDNTACHSLIEKLGATVTGQSHRYMPGHGHTARVTIVEMTADSWRTVRALPPSASATAHTADPARQP